MCNKPSVDRILGPCEYRAYQLPIEDDLCVMLFGKHQPKRYHCPEPEPLFERQECRNGVDVPLANIVLSQLRANPTKAYVNTKKRKVKSQVVI